jgi:flagellar biosynthesis protein FliR
MVFFVRIAGILMVYVAMKHNAIPAYTIVYSCYMLTYGDGECD